MKRRVSGGAPRTQRDSSAESTFPHILVVGIFAMVMLVWLTWQLSLQPSYTILSALGRSLVFVLLAAIVMATSRILTFLVGIAFIGAVLVDARGAFLIWDGAILWLAGGLTAFLLTLSRNSRFIAPPFNQEISRTSWMGFLLLLRHAFNELRYEVRPVRHAVNNIPNSFHDIKAGEIPTTQTYAVFQGMRFLSAQGPGYTMLQGKQMIKSVFDVRPQRRSQSLTVTTRDGISIDTMIVVNFQIRRPATPAEARIEFPYAKPAVRELMYANTVTQDDGERVIHPFMQVASRAAFYTSEEISRRTLDELLRVNEPDAEPLRELAEVVQEHVNGYFGDKGLEVTSIFITPLQLPREVLDARFGAWQGAWKGAISNLRKGTAIRPLSADQAAAQLSVVDDLMANIDTLYAAGDNIPEDMRAEIAARLREVVADAATEGLLKSLIPE